MNSRFLLLAGALVAGACAGNRVREQPILVNGDKTQTPDDVAARARVRGDAERALYAARRDSIAAAAAASCSGDVCSALTRGEVVLGMNTAQVMAATKTTAEAWSVRYAGRAAVMVGARPSVPPRDANGELGLVQLEDGKVTSYGYREPQGLRVIASATDASDAGRAKAQAAALIR
ncbi:MAG: hypothetical protein HY275_05925, partial [Gemmatimonadetes bacterium]|nr:hypothetical protein [Gemmatimonadota bacterium]